jgi:predicted RNA-binding Zn-ribbon protein involved in translation (DUF1610 family)
MANIKQTPVIHVCKRAYCPKCDTELIEDGLTDSERKRVADLSPRTRQQRSRPLPYSCPKCGYKESLDKRYPWSGYVKK